MRLLEVIESISRPVTTPLGTPRPLDGSVVKGRQGTEVEASTEGSKTSENRPKPTASMAHLKILLVEGYRILGLLLTLDNVPSTEKIELIVSFSTLKLQANCSAN